MILVLGGGISGLSVAYQLKKLDQNFLLIEKDNEVGGKIKSAEIQGFTIEKGPNTVLVNNSEIRKLLDELNLADQVIKADSLAIKNRYVLYNNTIEALPTSPISALKSPLIGWESLLKILKEPFLSKKEEEESLANFIRRRLGNQVYKNFIYPFVTGIYAGDPEKLSINFTLKMLKELESKHGSIIKGLPKMMKANKSKAEVEQLPKEKIFTLKSGLQNLPKAIGKTFEDRLMLSTEILEIRKKDQGFEVTVRNSKGQEESIQAQQIISTIPFQNLKSCCEFLNEEASLRSEIEYVPAIVYHFGFKKSDINLPKKGFGLLSREKETVPFLGILFNSQFFPHTATKDHELLTVITGGSKLRSLMSIHEEERRNLVLKSIKDLFSIQTDPVFENCTTWQDAIPQYNLGHQVMLDEINEFESKNPGMFLLGNYKDGISVSDCVSNGISFVKANFE